MKRIEIKNRTIRFNTFDEGADIHTAYDMLDNIYDVLREKFPDIDIVIDVDNFTEKDVEIESIQEHFIKSL